MRLDFPEQTERIRFCWLVFNVLAREAAGGMAGSHFVISSLFWVTSCLDAISHLHKNGKNSTRISHISFIQIPQLFTFCPACFYSSVCVLFFLNHFKIVEIL